MIHLSSNNSVFFLSMLQEMWVFTSHSEVVFVVLSSANAEILFRVYWLLPFCYHVLLICCHYKFHCLDLEFCPIGLRYFDT